MVEVIFMFLNNIIGWVECILLFSIYQILIEFYHQYPFKSKFMYKLLLFHFQSNIEEVVPIYSNFLGSKDIGIKNIQVF